MTHAPEAASPDTPDPAQPHHDTPETTPRWKRWGRVALELGLVLLIAQAVFWYQTRHHLSAESPAPPFQLKTLDGDTVALESLRGQRVLVYFWAPWCSVCRLESGAISALADAAAHDPDVTVVSVVVGYDGVDAVRDFVREHEATYTVLLGDRALARRYNVSAYPTLYVLNEQGAIHASTVGYTPSWSLRWRLGLGFW